MKFSWPWRAAPNQSEEAEPKVQLASIALEQIEQRIGSFIMGQANPQRDFPDAITKAREFKRNNGFVPAILRLRNCFFNAGLRFRPASGNEASQAFTDWAVVNNRKLRNYVGEVWDDWDHFDNSVSYWMPNSDVGRPIVLNLELCRYKDTFGKEVLEYAHGLTNAQIDELDLPEPVKEQWKQKKSVALDPKCFRVLKRERLGSGFAYPGIMSVSKPLSQHESMEVGDTLVAYVCRIVWEQHKMGHEVTHGPMAGTPAMYWKPERGEAFEKAMKGKVGHVRLTTNFDQDILFPYPDQAIFKGEKYQAVLDRLFWWALPFGHMIISKTVQPYLMNILRAVAEKEREMVGAYLDEVINESFAPPEPVHLTWSNRVLHDSRMAVDLLKVGLSAGPISQTTFLEEMGLEPHDERDNKSEEDKLPKAQTMPIYDAQHGAPDAANGRPAGTGDTK